MFTQAAQQILALLDAGQNTQARALFMKHLVVHYGKLDQALGRISGQNPDLQEYMWQRIQASYRTGCFNVSD